MGDLQICCVIIMGMDSDGYYQKIIVYVLFVELYEYFNCLCFLFQGCVKFYQEFLEF